MPPGVQCSRCCLTVFREMPLWETTLGRCVASQLPVLDRVGSPSPCVCARGESCSQHSHSQHTHTIDQGRRRKRVLSLSSPDLKTWQVSWPAHYAGHWRWLNSQVSFPKEGSVEKRNLLSLVNDFTPGPDLPYPCLSTSGTFQAQEILESRQAWWLPGWRL